MIDYEDEFEDELRKRTKHEGNNAEEGKVEFRCPLLVTPYLARAVSTCPSFLVQLSSEAERSKGDAESMHSA